MAKPPPLIYVDSSVLLDLITDEKVAVPGTELPRGVAAEHVLRGIEDGRARFATSALVELEVFATPRVRNDPHEVDRVTAALSARFSDPDTAWTDIDRMLTATARDILADIGPSYGKSTASAADIGHLAAAVRLGCTHFMTTDQGFPINTSVRQTRIMFPLPVWDAELF